jgi:hypothetical protein
MNERVRRDTWQPAFVTCGGAAAGAPQAAQHATVITGQPGDVLRIDDHRF